MKLRTKLRNVLEGWEDDLPSSWQAALGGTQLDFASRIFDHETHAEEIIIPGRKTTPVAGASADASIFRALENLSPEAVRAIILGQDPYPNPAWATGRAFEQGNLSGWPENRRLIADSLRRIVQVLVAARTGNPNYAGSDAGWKHLVRDLQHGILDLEPPRKLFDHLQSEGVLLLNTSLTVSVNVRNRRPTRSRGHFQLWQPLICRILKLISTKVAGQVVFLMWGQHAYDVFECAGIRAAAESAGTWETRVAMIRHVHPAAITTTGAAFLLPPNPFVSANKLLAQMGARPIRW